jgi:hypothetical protein
MRRTSMVSELRSGREFGALARELLDDWAPGALGLVDAGRWPQAVVDELAAALPRWELRPLPDLVRDQRVVPSESELALLRTGGAIVARAAERASRPGLAEPARVALVDGELRRAGFADVLVTCATADDGTVSVEITGQYRHGWLRAARLVEATTDPGAATADPGAAATASGGAAWAAVMRAGLAAAVEAATAGTTPAEISAAAAPILAELPHGAASDVAWINQADLSTNGEYEAHAKGARLPGGTVGAVSVEVLFPGGGRAVVADTVLVDTVPSVNTGPVNTGPVNTGPVNTGPVNTGPANAGGTHRLTTVAADEKGSTR